MKGLVGFNGERTEVCSICHKQIEKGSQCWLFSDDDIVHLHCAHKRNVINRKQRIDWKEKV